MQVKDLITLVLTVLSELDIDLISSSIPQEVLFDVSSEEDLEKLFTTESNITEKDQVLEIKTHRHVQPA